MQLMETFFPVHLWFAVCMQGIKMDGATEQTGISAF